MNRMTELTRRPPTEEKVYDSRQLKAGDEVWFSGYWVTLVAVRPDPYRKNEWRVEGTFPHNPTCKHVLWNFVPGAERRIVPTTRKLEVVVYEDGRSEVVAPPRNGRVPAAICAAFAFRHEWPSGAECLAGAEHADAELDLAADAAEGARRVDAVQPWGG